MRLLTPATRRSAIPITHLRSPAPFPTRTITHWAIPPPPPRGHYSLAIYLPPPPWAIPKGGRGPLPRSDIN